MNLGRSFTLAALAAAASIALPAAASAQSHPEFVPLGRASGAVYKPDSGPAPHIAYLVSHRTGNTIGSGTCRQLAQRGFLGLCFNTRFVNNEASVHWEDIALDVKAAVNYARTIPGITKVILLGHSGGSPLFSYYQAVAEAGVSYCQGANKLKQCSNAVAGMKPADGIVFPDAHPGNGVETLRAMDPSIQVKADGSWSVDPALDPFNEANGYNPKGNSHYSEEFRKKYYAAQSTRMNKLIADVQGKMAKMKAGDYVYPDNDLVVIPGGGNPNPGAGADAALHSYDPSIAESMSTARPERLLKNDGSIVTEVVHSVAVGSPNQAKGNRAFSTGTKIFTFDSFLSANAVKSTNSEDGIDWCSSNNSTICAVRSIKVPTLIAAMGAYKFIRDQEIMFDESAAKDKEYIVIEGAVHGYTACKPCEKTPGQYANSEKNMYDYIAKWTNARF